LQRQIRALKEAHEQGLALDLAIETEALVPAACKLAAIFRHFPARKARMEAHVQDSHAFRRRKAHMLHAPSSCFSETDRDWMMEHAGGALSKIEKTTLRVVAVNMTDNVSQAAGVLGMSWTSLDHWLSRRNAARRFRVVGRNT
jgi:hypothetical protein